MSTLKAIAQKCGVSTAAVSLAFTNPKRVSKKMRDKILKTAQELGYFQKKALKVKKIGLVFNGFANHFTGEYYQDVIQGIQQRLAQLKIGFQIMDGFEVEYAEIHEMNGLLFVGKTPDQFLSKAREFKIPCALVGHPNPNFDYHTIYFESEKTVIELTEYLISCGHKQIALMTGETNPRDAIGSKFLQSYKKALGNHKLEFDPKLIYQVDYSDIQSVEIAWNKIISHKKKNQITALMCTNDLLAYYCYQMADKCKMKIPDQISITGFDGIVFPRYVFPAKPALTTAITDRVRLGMESIDYLLEIIKNPQKVQRVKFLESFLSIRDSVKRIN